MAPPRCGFVQSSTGGSTDHAMLEKQLIEVGYRIRNFCSDTDDIIVASDQWTALGDASLLAIVDLKHVRLKTGLSPIIFNGYLLRNRAEYIIENLDVITVNDMTYTVRFMETVAINAKKMKTDSASHKITSFFQVSSPSSSAKLASSQFGRIGGTWIEQRDHLIFTPDSCEGCAQIAAFDLDGTLIKPKSGKRYPENAHDWMLLYKCIPKKLREYHEKKYKLVAFSNQLPLGVNPMKRSEFKQKVEAIVNTINLPIQVFVATQRNIMRKPCPGMWDSLSENNGDKEIDKTGSFYVGDAAGRPKTLSGPKDHSFADLLFARNIQVKFYTPEEFFLNAKPAKVTIPFEPRVDTKKIANCFTVKESDCCEVVLMVGAPASGKSTFSRKLIAKGYVHISRDELNSWQKCVQILSDCLKNRKRVVIDNTNRDKDSRKRFLDIAKRFNVPCRCFHMKVDKIRAMHNNKYRELIQSQHVQVSDIIIHSYYKGFEEPQLDEGFDEIVPLAFIPEFTSSEYKEQQLYEMYLLEKY